jgi:N-formylglutamate amidohydrolase
MIAVRVNVLRCRWAATAPCFTFLLAGLATESPTREPSTPGNLVTIQQGTLPIILSAPHGGREVVPGVAERHGDGARKFATVWDENTAELAARLSAALEKKLNGKPYLVVARFARKYVDANRPAQEAYESADAKPYYDAYHRPLAEACREVRRRWGRGLLLDLHGQSTQPGSVFRGTGNGKTVSLLCNRFGKTALSGPKSIFGQLQSRGYQTIPAANGDQKEDAHFNGGYIVQTYGSQQPAGVDAVQLELGRHLRSKDRLDQTTADLAAAIEAFAREYLSEAMPEAASRKGP